MAGYLILFRLPEYKPAGNLGVWVSKKPAWWIALPAGDFFLVGEMGSCAPDILKPSERVSCDRQAILESAEQMHVHFLVWACGRLQVFLF